MIRSNFKALGLLLGFQVLSCSALMAANGTNPNPSNTSTGGGRNREVIAFQDRDDSLFDRNMQRTNADYRENWQYNAGAYLSGQSPVRINPNRYSAEYDQYENEPRNPNFNNGSQYYYYQQPNDQQYFNRSFSPSNTTNTQYYATAPRNPNSTRYTTDPTTGTATYYYSDNQTTIPQQTYFYSNSQRAIPQQVYYSNSPSAGIQVTPNSSSQVYYSTDSNLPSNYYSNNPGVGVQFSPNSRTDIQYAPQNGAGVYYSQDNTRPGSNIYFSSEPNLVR